MTRIEIDGESYACPFAGLLRPLTPSEEAALDSSIAKHGIRSPVLWYFSPLHGRAIVDGMNRSTIGLRYGKEIPLLSLGKLDDATAKALARSLNADRRHLTPEEQAAARGERVKKVVAAAGEGKSTRVIAGEVGVSQAQVRRDLADATQPGETGDSPVTTPPSSEALVTSLPSVVLGADNKTYPAKQKRKHVTNVVKAYRTIERLRKLLAAICRSQQRPRLEALAAAAGMPLDGTDWPALEVIRAVLRDLARPGASV